MNNMILKRDEQLIKSEDHIAQLENEVEDLKMRV